MIDFLLFPRYISFVKRLVDFHITLGFCYVIMQQPVSTIVEAIPVQPIPIVPQVVQSVEEEEEEEIPKGLIQVFRMVNKLRSLCICYIVVILLIDLTRFYSVLPLLESPILFHTLLDLVLHPIWICVVFTLYS